MVFKSTLPGTSDSRAGAESIIATIHPLLTLGPQVSEAAGTWRRFTLLLTLPRSNPANLSVRTGWCQSKEVAQQKVLIMAKSHLLVT